MVAKRVLVTRAAHQAGKLSEGLRAAGFEPVEVPVLEIRHPVDCGPLDAALRNLTTYDWLIVTSANTVRALVERAAALGIALTESASLQVAAVGESTAMDARKAGFVVTVVPQNYVAESLIEELLCHARNVSGHDFSRAKESEQEKRALAHEGSLRGQKILLARAEIARDVIPDALRAAGASVDVVDAYRNVLPDAAAGLLRAALEQGIDAATFTSSSSVTHLAEAAREAGIAFPFAGVPAVSIGPITSATLREHGWEPVAEATQSDIPGLIAVVRRLANSLTC